MFYKMGESLKTSLIICTLNRQEDLLKTLRSIYNQTLVPNEVIIIDASNNNDSKILNSYFPDVKHFHFNKKPSLTKQRNFGVKNSTGNSLIFLDDDVELCPNYLAEACKFLISNPEVIGCSGIVINDIFPLLKILRNIFYYIFWGNTFTRIRSSLGPTIIYPITRPIQTFRLSGCNMIIKKDVFQNVRFDEKFEDYSLGEDIDFSLSLRKRGKMYFIPEAKLKHNKSRVNRYSKNRWFKSCLNNYSYISKKHFKKSFKNQFYYSLGSLGLLIEFLIICCIKKAEYKDDLFKLLLFNVVKKI